MEQAKDISLVDLEELGRKDLPRWGIILTGFSSRHLHRMAQNLVRALQEIEIEELMNPPKLYGRKDDDWILVECKDIMVHMFTEESRDDIALEYKWRYKISDEEMNDWESQHYALKKKWSREGGQSLKKSKFKKKDVL
jgi:ribosomal silencing factor RsfS